MNSVIDILIKKIQLIESKLSLNNDDVVFAIATQLLVVTYFLFVHELPFNAIVAPILLLPGILFREISTNKIYLSCLMAIFAFLYLYNGLEQRIPNHKHLFVYVTILFFISSFYKAKEFVYLFKHGSRLIIGFVFLFATIGKFLAPEFLNGSFFEFTGLVDSRFSGFTAIVTSLSMSELVTMRESFQQLLNSNNISDLEIQLESTVWKENLSLFMAYWTIFIEGMIAVTFIISTKYKLSMFRDLFLIIFMITTYPIATVPGFAAILTVLAFAQSSLHKSELKYLSILYLCIFVLIPIFSFPFYRLYSFIFY